MVYSYLGRGEHPWTKRIWRASWERHLPLSQWLRHRALVQFSGGWTQVRVDTFFSPFYTIRHIQYRLSINQIHVFCDRLLKAMGWQEYPENDDFQPLTEDELKEFQAKTEQVLVNQCKLFLVWQRMLVGKVISSTLTKRLFSCQMKKIGLGRNGVLLKRRGGTLLNWRTTPNPGLEEGSESETSSSSQTSDDDDT